MEVRKSESTLSDKQLLVLSAMASDVRFATEIGFQIKQDTWDNEWARILAMWICDYVRYYNDTPISILPTMAREKADTIPDEDTAESVCRFSEKIVEYGKSHSEIFRNYKYLCDVSLKWIKERNLEVLRDSIEDALDGGDVKRAEAAVHTYAEVKKVEFTSVDMMRDVNRIRNAFEQDNTELFTFPGALGKATGPFHRGDLFLIMAESGAGKSFMAQKVGLEALRHGLSVLYLNFEIEEDQLIRRLYIAMSRRPKEDSEVTVPYFRKTSYSYDVTDDDDDGDDEVRTGYKYEVCQRSREMKGVDLDEGCISRFLKGLRMSTNGGRFQMKSMAPQTYTIRDIEREMDNMRDYMNFVPDILIVDYGDLVKPESRRDEKRTQINDIYLGLRRIALDRHILVVSPTQSNRDGYGKDMKKQNMSENIGNINHTAVLWGLSHSPKEKEMGITRVKILKNRDHTECADPIICLGCLDIGDIALDSRRKNEVMDME